MAKPIVFCNYSYLFVEDGNNSIIYILLVSRLLAGLVGLRILSPVAVS